MRKLMRVSYNPHNLCGFVDFDHKTYNLFCVVMCDIDFQKSSRWQMNSRLGRNFWIYRCGQIATALGYSASSIAVIWWVLGEYQKMIYVSYVIVPPLIISAISQPLVAPLGDRFNKKRLLQYGLAIQFVSYLIVAAIFIVGKMNIAVLIAFEMLSTTGKIIFNSGSIGILPHLVSENDIPDGINITQRINSVMSILGGALGGSMVTFLGVANSFLFLSACLLVAFLLCMLIHYSAQSENAGANISTWINDVKDGFRYTIQNPVVSGFFIYSIIIGIAFAPMTLAFPYIIKEINGLPPLFVGFLTTSMGSGVILGSLCLPYLKRVFDSKYIVYLSSTLFFLSLLLVGVYHHVVVLFIGQFIIGLSRNWINVTVDSLLMVNLPKELRTRVLSNLMFFAMINMPLAMLIFGGLMDALGVYNIFLVLSMLSFAGMLAIVSNKGVRGFLSAKPEEAMAMLSRE